ncbi:MAG: hypothetical protein KBG28_26065 [Kofleriaceae bacterium]|jgi:hypothetical protein|nr:hypothetical protein [Kofleriaceae bacterium]MBP6836548.1 hypothetical protein [Kofleriaceae bacterium]MBP9207460.1 hypothetical protein [Kofleriaceae bacterium]
MSYREAKELALLRQTLRDCLTALDPQRAHAALARLADLARAGTDAELSAEADRWAFRFGLLAAA